MKFFSVVVLAAGFATASVDTTSDSTTTVTSTLTKTLTLTQCNPTYTDCPYRTPTTTEVAAEETKYSYPAHNTTIVAHSTGGSKNSTTGPTMVTATQTSLVAGASSTGVIVSTSGAGSLYIDSGLLMGILAAGAALL